MDVIAQDIFAHKNFFRVAADFTHLSSKFILIYTIHRLRSAEGVSFLTQFLYLLVFLMRYLDLFWTFTEDWYQTTFKLIYIGTSIYTLWLMLKRFPRSREGEREWRVSAWILVIGVVVGIAGCWVIKWAKWSTIERGCRFPAILWNISLVVESLHLLPQLSLLSHISTPTVINSYYLFALGTYRFLYILNWIDRRITTGWFEPMPVVTGVVQTYTYLEFAWVYWRRQRVKLRQGGAVLDREDWVTGGLVLRLVFGNEEGAGRGKATTGGSWREWARTLVPGGSRPAPRRRGSGGRGLSVSADEDGVGGMLSRTQGYEDEERDLEEGRGRERADVRREESARGEEGRVLFGADSEDEEEEHGAKSADAAVWRSNVGGGSAGDEGPAGGIVLAGSDDEEDYEDEGRMTSNEIRDRRG
ncbi:ER lumen protein retaining receptor-domain-containing protein [Kalaharituber pfeilii]|nr:ER lumen protein retaining receptor-domain-containing protein [Kalaharituber pfeilii]